ncbi:hypothetical protein VV02_19590 [Luteipulveratus mongoliensis]|uniref:Lipoprotein n=2 Tax=Luteipulveratus mongoliensis TaxID=571913 RepID=A0A0K1JLS2_9MICO|nr:hypothetical protein VV02_19590 [Luteipulveratus mongoliensis]
MLGVLTLLLAACSSGSGTAEPSTSPTVSSSAARPSATASATASTAPTTAADPTALDDTTDFADPSNPDNWDEYDDGPDEHVKVDPGGTGYVIKTSTDGMALLTSQSFAHVRASDVSVSMRTVSHATPADTYVGVACMSQLNTDGSMKTWYSLSYNGAGHMAIVKSSGDRDTLLAEGKIPNYRASHPPTVDIRCRRTPAGVELSATVAGSRVVRTTAKVNPLPAGEVFLQVANGRQRDKSGSKIDRWVMSLRGTTKTQ